MLSTYRRWVDNFLAQESILAGVLVEQTPIHFDIPGVGVAGGHNRGDDPQPGIGIVKCAGIVRCKREYPLKNIYLKPS